MASAASFPFISFPSSLAQLMAEEMGLQVDMQGCEKAMTDAREMSRGARTKVRGRGLGPIFSFHGALKSIH